ncbi:hypothetical protein DWB85_18600 [Seongchinamella sediminis]|uniref:Uncharacterized protein n=1 Tax=Seongchinamella sediminis TaxID=2283635 RepID=A0A3L7DVC6_9GAMM|nr:tellurite resistance TerB family protein [Seongchinamella sediminis]RLQ20253.1 hypothetical protein DWB85_18600 [Seongchinamella sediminis]
MERLLNSELRAAPFFQKLSRELSANEVKLMCFGDFSGYLASYDGDVELSKESVRELANLLAQYNIASIPHIRSGANRQLLSNPLVVLEDSKSLNRTGVDFRNALLITKVAALMAKSDSVVSEGESARVLARVDTLRHITEEEKVYLKAQSLYLLSTPTRRDLVLHKLAESSPTLKALVLDVAKDVAIADGVVEEAELDFLQDLYRVFDMSARSARYDIEEYAREHYVVLDKKQRIAPIIEEETVCEFEDVLEDLLSDFEF